MISTEKVRAAAAVGAFLLTAVSGYGAVKSYNNEKKVDQLVAASPSKACEIDFKINGVLVPVKPQPKGATK